MIAAGLGCRKGCSTNDVLGALAAALRAARYGTDDVRGLFIPDFKRDEPALVQAARALGRPLTTLSRELLATQRTLSASAYVQRAFGLSSVAEAAALAGACIGAPAGASARLLGPRVVVGGATCALATLDLSDFP